MPRRISQEEWDRRLSNDPAVRWEDDEPPLVRRKVPVIVDENLAGFVDVVRRAKNLKVVASPRRGSSDAEIWAYARQHQAVILTADGKDFWDDRKFQLQECPGLVVLVGATEAARRQALSHVLKKSPLVEDRQRYGTSRDMKIKANSSGEVEVKRYIEGEIVVEEL